MVSSTSIPPADVETNVYLIAQLRNMKFVLEEIDLINDLVDYKQEQIQMLSKIIPQFEDVLLRSKKIPPTTTRFHIIFGFPSFIFKGFSPENKYVLVIR